MYTRNFEVRYLIITVPYLVRAFKSNRDKNCRVMGGSCHFTLFSYQCILSHSNQRNFLILNENNLSKCYQNLTPQEINIRPLVKFSHYSVDKMVRNKLNLVLLIHREAGFGIIHFPDIRSYPRSQLTMHPGLSVLHLNRSIQK